MKDERDTQRMHLRPEDIESPSVKKFDYRTDPGAPENDDAELLRGVTRARAERDQREETLRGLDAAEPSVDPGPAPAAQRVTIVHKQQLPTWLVWAVLALPIAILVVALLNVRKNRAESRAAASSPPPSASLAPTSASATATQVSPVPTPSALPIAPLVHSSAPPARTHAPTATTTAPVQSAPAPATTHTDPDIVRTL